MHIIVDLEGYYDWEPMADGAVPSEADLQALRAKATQDGKWLQKVLREGVTHTEINLPESEIADCLAHFERKGAPKTRARLVAWYLEDKVMPHHAHPDHFTKITVENEPEVEAFLARFFDCKAGGKS